MRRFIFLGLVAVVAASGGQAAEGRKAKGSPPDSAAGGALRPYLQPGTPAVGGVRHLLLIYCDAQQKAYGSPAAWDGRALLPYVTYVDRQGKPQDWFFDSFLWIGYITSDGANLSRPVEGPYVQERVPTWVSPIKDENGRWISSHVINQDIVAWVGQGRIADRTKENLRSSDIGITMMRNRFFQEIDAVAAGKEPAGVIRSANAAACIALPNMAREFNTEGIALADFDKDPILRQRLKEFRHHYGQPPAVRRAFVEAMGLTG